MSDDDIKLPTTINSDSHFPPIWDETTIEKAYLRKTNGKIKAGYTNILARLRHSSQYHGIFRYDAVRQLNMVCKPTPWDVTPFSEPRPVTKDDITYLKSALEVDGLSVNRGDLVCCINSVCKEFHLGTYVPVENFELLTILAIECLKANPTYSTEGILKALNLRDKPKKHTNRRLVQKLLKEAGYENRAYLQGRRWEPATMPYYDKIWDGSCKEVTET